MIQSCSGDLNAQILNMAWSARELSKIALSFDEETCWPWDFWVSKPFWLLHVRWSRLWWVKVRYPQTQWFISTERTSTERFRGISYFQTHSNIVLLVMYSIYCRYIHIYTQNITHTYVYIYIYIHTWININYIYIYLHIYTCRHRSHYMLR